MIKCFNVEVIYLVKYDTKEFDDIVIDILENDNFRKLNWELHHGISRYDHSLRVAKATYRATKKLHLNYIDATRAALLHDFYLNHDFDNQNPAQILEQHPYQSLENAKRFFSINEMQENMIVSHMFPVGKIKPKYTESWILTTVDKSVATYEQLRFKASLVLGIWTLFIFNMITLNNR